MKEKRRTGAIICLFLIMSLTACGGTKAEFSGGKEYIFSETESDELYNEELTNKESGGVDNKEGSSQNTQSGTLGQSWEGADEGQGDSSGEGGSAGSANGEESIETICVYLCGAVVHPGVYTLPLGSRLCDGIDLAGGMTETACQEYWNLAEVLCDGQMVYVPTEEEAKDRMPFSEMSTGNRSGNENKGSLAESGQKSGEGSYSADSGKVNINTAAAELLMTLPGIGESKANNIVAYREEYGLFQEISDIKNVAGIKDGVYNQVKDFITVD